MLPSASGTGSRTNRDSRQLCRERHATPPGASPARRPGGPGHQERSRERGDIPTCSSAGSGRGRSDATSICCAFRSAISSEHRHGERPAARSRRRGQEEPGSGFRLGVTEAMWKGRSGRRHRCRRPARPDRGPSYRATRRRPRRSRALQRAVVELLRHRGFIAPGPCRPRRASRTRFLPDRHFEAWTRMLRVSALARSSTGGPGQRRPGSHGTRRRHAVRDGR